MTPAELYELVEWLSYLGAIALLGVLTALLISEVRRP